MSLRIGLGIGFPPVSRREGVGGWWDRNAILDADFANSRFRWNGVSYADETSFLAAIGGTKSGNVRVIGPNTVPGAPELLTNTTFDANLTGWTSVLNGTSNAAIVAAAAQLTSDGSTGLGAGGGGITQPVVTEADTPYVVEVVEGVGAVSIRTSDTLYGINGGGGLALGGATTRLPVVARTTQTHVYAVRTAAGVANVNNVSMKKCNLFEGFVQGEYAVDVEGVMPAAFAGNQFLFDLVGDSIIANAVRAYVMATGVVRVQVYQGANIFVQLDIPAIAAGAAFKLRVSLKLNEVVVRLNGGAIFTDTSSNVPKVSRLWMGQDSAAANSFVGTIKRMAILLTGGIDGLLTGTDIIHTDGDSFMGGAYGVILPNTLATSSGRAVFNTGVGGNTIDQITARIIAASAAVRARTTVIWDGDQNGIVSVADYCDKIATAIAALGHSRFILIPACVNYGQADVTQEVAIRDEMLLRWPNNVLDWRTVLPMTAGYPTQPMFYDTGSDLTHLSQAAMDLMAAAIKAFIDTKGW